MKRKTLNVFVRLMVVILLPVILSACVEPSVKIGTVQCRGNACATQHYVIGAGDVLYISVWKEPELDRTVTVRPDGMISYPLVDNVPATGLTPRQLQKKLTTQLKKYISMPVVSVVVQEVHSFEASVLGKVTEPGLYELDGAVTVLDMLAKAKGLTQFASPSDITVLRTVNNRRVRIPFDYEEAISRDGGQEVFYVRSGDVILVP